MRHGHDAGPAIFTIKQHFEILLVTPPRLRASATRQMIHGGQTARFISADDILLACDFRHDSAQVRAEISRIGNTSAEKARQHITENAAAAMPLRVCA